MKKIRHFSRIVCVVLLGGVFLTGTSGCHFAKYCVDYGDKKDFFKNAKSSYRAGSTVKLFYGESPTDTVFTFYLSGSEISPQYDKKNGFYLQFVMPAHDVELEIGKANLTEVVKKAGFKDEQVLSFNSFDGGGPEFSVEIEDPSIITYTSEHIYAKEDHEELCGAGYDVIFTFKGSKPGSTVITVFSSSPIIEPEAYTYVATVDENLKINLESRETQE